MAKYTPEMRQRALRMLGAPRGDHANLMTAIRHVAGLLGMSSETLRMWQRRYEVDTGARPGVPDLGDPASNWARNESVLLNEMARGNAIRDSSVDSDGKLLLEDSGRFIVKERDVLRANSWQYDEGTTLWSPPAR